MRSIGTGGTGIGPGPGSTGAPSGPTGGMTDRTTSGEKVVGGIKLPATWETPWIRLHA